MIVTTKNRKKVYEMLFKEGVMYAPKNFLMPQHPKLEGIRNIEVIKLMQSLVSRGHCEEQFCWQHIYWTLTDAGIEYIREYLALPAGVVPATKAMANKAEVPAGGGRGGFGGGFRGGRGGYGGGRGRGGYGDRPGFGRSRGGFGGPRRTETTPAPAPATGDE
jgi:small subunit ribosomal protein S10e